jgi:peptidoglycan/xylan/chitin deacetylase (PgdA/CDA1 family)
VLTVDDSTVAGAEACLAARALGHAVTFFVNPLQIERREHYYFSALDTQLDARRIESVQYGEHWYSFGNWKEVKRFRLAVRERLMDLNHDDARELTEEIGAVLQSEARGVPAHLEPVGIPTLRVLLDAGVRIENHGWDHTSIRAMGAPQFADHLTRAADWIEKVVHARPTFYAVPYGTPDLTESQRAVLVGECFVLDASFSDGPCTGSVNRTDLTGIVRAFE